VRAAYRGGVARQGDGVLEAHLDSALVEPRDDLLGAPHALLLGAGARGLDRLEVDPVAEHVQVLVQLVHARDLHRRDELDAGRVGCGLRLGEAIDRVVVAERQNCHARIARRLHHPGGGQLAVREGRVRLKLDHVRPQPSVRHGAARPCGVPDTPNG
jgi:hypothetical protein